MVCSPPPPLAKCGGHKFLSQARLPLKSRKEKAPLAPSQMYGQNSERSHKIRVPFGIGILCCRPYIIMVNIVGEPKEDVGTGLAWETKLIGLDRDCNSTVVACKALLVRFYGLPTKQLTRSRLSVV